MTTQRTLAQVRVHGLVARRFIGRFDDRPITSDGGGLQLRETDVRLCVSGWLGRCLGDCPYSDRVGTAFRITADGKLNETAGVACWASSRRESHVEVSFSSPNTVVVTPMKRAGMARKNKTRKRARAHSAPPLEQLLHTADPESYGRVCWYLANRDTERHRAGDLLSLDVPDATGALRKRKYRLTGQSIENIARCLGMRSPEQASPVFIKSKDEQPRGECPRGHPEAAFDYMMSGIAPTKPCPQCGQIPRFDGSIMSLNFGSNEPVKGTDGSVYRTCPDCGDDMLELQGTDLHGWGWDIACTNCGWRMKQAEELDVQQYSELMEQIKLKVDAIEGLMDMPGIINQTRVESVCLQLRMILELIMFSSLVSNKDAWRKSQDQLRKAWNVKKIMTDLKAIHARYYPEPRGDAQDFLTQDRLVSVYDRLNGIIHAENPLGAGVDLRRCIDAIPKWLKWIVNLLTEHKLFLYHHPNVFYWVRMFGGPESNVLCTPIRTDTNGKEICAWPDCVQEGNRTHCEYIGDSWRKCRLKPLEPQQTEAKKAAEEYDRSDATASQGVVRLALSS